MVLWIGFGEDLGGTRLEGRMGAWARVGVVRGLCTLPGVRYT